MDALENILANLVQVDWHWDHCELQPGAKGVRPRKRGEGNPIAAGCWRSRPGQKGLGLRVLRAGLLGTS